MFRRLSLILQHLRLIRVRSPAVAVPAAAMNFSDIVLRKPKKASNQPKGPNQDFLAAKLAKEAPEQAREADRAAREKSKKVCIYCGRLFDDKVVAHDCTVDYEMEMKVPCPKCGNFFCTDALMGIHAKKCWNGWHINAVGVKYVKGRHGNDSNFVGCYKMWR